MKFKKLLSIFLAIFTMFFMIEGVSAIETTSFNNSSIKSTIESNITKQGNLGYYISETDDATARTREEHFGSVSNPLEHGSINVFGYDGTTIYETSALNSNGLSGIFPVFYVGSNVANLDVTNSLIGTYNYLTYNSTNKNLSGTSGDITVTVNASHVLNDQFIKLTYTAKNSNTTTAKTISMAGYSDVAMDGVDNVKLTPENNILSKGGKGFSMFVTTTAGATRKMYVVTEDFEHVTNAQYWIGDGDVNTLTNEYSKAFSTSNKTFDDISAITDSRMAFSWTDIEIPANGTVTKSVLIGLGDIKLLDIDVTGESEYNLDNVKNVNVNIKYVVPNDGNAYKLYYKLNDGDIVTANDVDLTKTVDATKVLDLINDADLNKCGDNTLTAWIGPSTDSKLTSAIVKDEHKFKVTSASCVGVVEEKKEDNPQTGVTTNYLILGLILAGGIGTYIYGRKHNKFPQV